MRPGEALRRSRRVLPTLADQTPVPTRIILAVEPSLATTVTCCHLRPRALGVNKNESVQLSPGATDSDNAGKTAWREKQASKIEIEDESTFIDKAS
jgi:hypothetical protein